VYEKVNWDQYIQYDKDEEPMGMRFDDHEVVYPTVPEQGANNLFHCGIFVMMFLEHWTTPRSLITQIFSVSDVPCIRINIANDLMFIPANTGLKRLVTSYRKEEEE